MRRLAWPLLVVAAMFACSDDRDGFDRDHSFFESDAGAEAEPPAPTSCEGTLRCGRDLRSVVDGCDESKVIAQCGPDQGCADGKCVPACEVGAGATIGCDFVPLPPPPESLAMGSCFAAVLANTWDLPAAIEAEYEGSPIDVPSSAKVLRTDGETTTLEPFTGELQPGEVAVLFLSEQASGLQSVACPAGATPAVRKLTATTGTRRGPTFRIKTTAPVSAYSMYPFAGSSSQGTSATMLLPVTSWKTDYLVTSPWEMRYFGAEDSLTKNFPSTQVVAAEDGTEVTLLSSVHVIGGADVESAEKGVPKVYHLNRGEQIQFWQEQDLTGTRIGSNKPIGVWTGHQAMAIPTTTTCCGDTSQTTMFPLRSWGREYAVVPYRSRRTKEIPEDYLYRVTAAVDGTVLTYEPSAPKDAPVTLAAGQSVFFSSQEAFVVRSQDIAHPFAIFAYMTGEQFARARKASRAIPSSCPSYLPSSISAGTSSSSTRVTRTRSSSWCERAREARTSRP